MENLDLFKRMRNGEFADGSRVLRALIDMASPNINMRDPTLYRIRHGVIHHQTGEEWCIYPMYDYTHPISGDRGITLHMRWNSDLGHCMTGCWTMYRYPVIRNKSRILASQSSVR
jgi:hypothetical protein